MKLFLKTKQVENIAKLILVPNSRRYFDLGLFELSAFFLENDCDIANLLLLHQQGHFGCITTQSEWCNWQSLKTPGTGIVSVFPTSEPDNPVVIDTLHYPEQRGFESLTFTSVSLLNEYRRDIRLEYESIIDRNRFAVCMAIDLVATS